MNDPKQPTTPPPTNQDNQATISTWDRMDFIPSLGIIIVCGVRIRLCMWQKYNAHQLACYGGWVDRAKNWHQSEEAAKATEQFWQDAGILIGVGLLGWSANLFYRHWKQTLGRRH